MSLSSFPTILLVSLSSDLAADFAKVMCLLHFSSRLPSDHYSTLFPTFQQPVQQLPTHISTMLRSLLADLSFPTRLSLLQTSLLARSHRNSSTLASTQHFVDFTRSLRPQDSASTLQKARFGSPTTIYATQTSTHVLATLLFID